MPASRSARCGREQQILPDGSQARSVSERPVGPYLEVLNAACKSVFRLGSTGGNGRRAVARSIRMWRCGSWRCWMPAACLSRCWRSGIAAPGGSDTSFDTQLIAPLHRQWQPLLARPAQSLLEGGVYVGSLGPRVGVGVAVWNFVWAPSEAHVSPHRYTLQRLRWATSHFVPLPPLTTRGKYTDPAPRYANCT